MCLTRLVAVQPVTDWQTYQLVRFDPELQWPRLWAIHPMPLTQTRCQASLRDAFARSLEGSGVGVGYTLGYFELVFGTDTLALALERRAFISWNIGLRW